MVLSIVNESGKCYNVRSCPHSGTSEAVFADKNIGALYMSIVSKMFGTHSERELKRVYPIVDKIESYRPYDGAD